MTFFSSSSSSEHLLWTVYITQDRKGEEEENKKKTTNGRETHRRELSLYVEESWKAYWGREKVPGDLRVTTPLPLPWTTSAAGPWGLGLHVWIPAKETLEKNHQLKS